ncbi:MAG: hypothetical protein K1X66_08040 [Verrucomicrobiae bacterium]|nr:hypothetical protein [Verrucomicrobiae bacterium]
MGQAVCVDKLGNAYVAGNYTAPITFGNFILPLNGPQDFFIAKYNSQGKLLSLQRGSLGKGSEKVTSIAVDDMGHNLYVTGSFAGQGKFIDKVFNANGNSDIFIAKYDITSNLKSIWVRQIGDSTMNNNTDQWSQLGIDAKGNCYITGTYRNDILFNSNPFILLTSSGETDVWVAKFSGENGACQWAQRIQGNANAFDRSHDICVSPQGNSYVVARCTGNAIEVDNLKINTLQSQSLAIVKYNPQGIPQWTIPIGAGDAGSIENFFEANIAIDSSEENLYVSGTFIDTLNIGNKTISIPCELFSCSQNTFLAKFSPQNGNFEWVRTAQPNDGIARNDGLAVDDIGNGVLGGWFLTFSNNPKTLVFENTISEQNKDIDITPFIERIFIAKYSSTGSLLWVNATSGGTPDALAQVTGSFLRDIAVNPQGNVFSTGEFTNTDIQFGNLPPLPLSEPQSSQQISYWIGQLSDSIIFESFP